MDRAVFEAGRAGQLQVVANAAVGYDNIDVPSAQDVRHRRLQHAGSARRHHGRSGLSPHPGGDPPEHPGRGGPPGRDAGPAGDSTRTWPATSTGRHSGWSATAASAVPWHSERPASTWRSCTRRATTPECPATWRRLHELLQRSDIVSLHVPLSETTRHLIGAAELAQMKPTAVLVNTARGPVVDENALVDALEAGSLYAAGLDVFDGEPAVNPRLLKAPRVTLLPHVGSATIGTRTRMARLACQGVADVLGGPNAAEPHRSDNSRGVTTVLLPGLAPKASQSRVMQGYHPLDCRGGGNPGGGNACERFEILRSRHLCAVTASLAVGIFGAPLDSIARWCDVAAMADDGLVSRHSSTCALSLALPTRVRPNHLRCSRGQRQQRPIDHHHQTTEVYLDRCTPPQGSRPLRACRALQIQSASRAADTGIFKSTDGGTSWSLSGFRPFTADRFRASSATSALPLEAASTISETTDGRTWTPQMSAHWSETSGQRVVPERHVLRRCRTPKR